jgi:hypothetical protein
MEWYHTNLHHPGVACTLNLIGQTFGWKGMRTHVEAFVKSCNECQRHKIVGKPQYGILPLVSAFKVKMPYEKVHMDCAGPWTVCISSKASQDRIEYQIHVMLIVDAGSGWIELKLIPTANSKSCAMQFDKQWLCHYQRPTECGHNNSSKFIGEEFQELLLSYGIKSEPTTVKNPTAQSVIECLHLTLGDSLCTSIHSDNDWQDDTDHLIQVVGWALRTTTPSNIPYNPGQMTFGMDMIF